MKLWVGQEYKEITQFRVSEEEKLSWSSTAMRVVDFETWNPEITD